MPLSSRLFQLEAAANDDSAHITPGARGPHVEKIQTALNILDSAGLGVDGRYGPATATAVLNYKTKRNIINRSYQTLADNIVGKMHDGEARRGDACSGNEAFGTHNHYPDLTGAE
jgi:peptidoglycan hydrolase-like protein with peptidoglycan-binding domain